MQQQNDRPWLLMIHGVSSTLEWSSTVCRVIEPHFRCKKVCYRYFHALWGPVKVYIWPTALLLCLAYGLLAVPHMVALHYAQPDPVWLWSGNLLSASGGNFIALAILLGVLLFESYIVIVAELQWMRNVEKTSPVLAPPIVFAVAGVIGALICAHPWQWAFPVASLVGISFFLDLREYPYLDEDSDGHVHPDGQLSIQTLTFIPLIVMVAVGLMVRQLFIQQSFTVSEWVILCVIVLGLVEPFFRIKLAMATTKAAIVKARRSWPEPFVIAHSLGTYLTGNVLRESPQFNFGRILFTGCVLERHYPWGGNGAEQGHFPDPRGDKLRRPTRYRSVYNGRASNSLATPDSTTAHSGRAWIDESARRPDGLATIGDCRLHRFQTSAAGSHAQAGQ